MKEYVVRLRKMGRGEAPRISVWRRDSIKRPLTRTPNEELIMWFQCSRLAPHSAEMPALLAINRTQYERARDMGELSQADWIQQYGQHGKAFSDAKKCFDPHNVLKPGPAICPNRPSAIEALNPRG
jgi:Cytokinin dehydrogenase 1, FAD and cytokinin binding